MKNNTNKKQSVREILLMGVFWRILIIEAILLVYSLFYRWLSQDASAVDLFWYAVRIIILVGIIIAFMMITLRKFLSDRVIKPLESIAIANKEIEQDFTKRHEIKLDPNAPDEIQTIVTSRTDMLNRIIDVSNERLQLVNFIKKTFGRYLSDKVVDEILNSPEGPKIGGSRKTVTILMADLRGFTSMSESRDPEEMVQMLNRYLEKMSKIIIKYDGIIDEIIGDAVLAVFGALETHEDDPERAIACAIEMQNKLIELNKEIKIQGYPLLEMGIGINTGNVIVGNIGSDLRMKYGIVGDTVNRAARIESNSIGGQILIGESTYNTVQDLVTSEPPKTVMMKGMRKPLVFYSISALETGDDKLILMPPANTDSLFDINLPFQCWTIQDKKISPFSISGETISMDETIINVVTSNPIALLADIKLKFDFCIEAHCFDDIYAKCSDSKSDQNTHFHELRITAMEEKDRALIKKWITEISN